MRVFLINPPDQKMVRGATPKELGAERMGAYPPLGLLYLAQALKVNLPEVQVSIIDAIAERMPSEEIRRLVSEGRPDVVGISTYTFTLLDALDVARMCKQVDRNLRVVLGGFHPTIYPGESLQCSPDVDFAVAGEAEETFVELIRRLIAHQPCAGIEGVSFRKPDGALHVDRRIPFVADLDRLPFPDRRLVNYRHHRCIIGSQGLMTSILSSRGCPFTCKYCFVNVRKYRLRSVESLILEIKDCLNLGISEFFFMDDLFNITKQRVEDFSDRVLQEGLKITWAFRGRVDQIDEQVLRKAKQAGCIRIHYGVESGVPALLARVAKGTDLEMVKRALSLTRRAGIEVAANVMIGLPGETRADTEQTIRYTLSLDTDYLAAAVFTPYPETPLYKESLQSGLAATDYWREFARQPREDFETRVWGEFYTRAELFEQLRRFYRRFYLRPRFILSYLRRLRSLKQWRMAAMNGLTFLKLATARGD